MKICRFASILLLLSAGIPAALRVASGLDVDGDSVSDVYADHHGLEAGDGGEDADGDGQTNAEESAWGTDPNANDSFGRVTVESAPGLLEITLDTLPGKIYRFQGSPDLVDWNEMGDSFVGTLGTEHLFIALPLVGTDAFFARAESMGEVDEDEDGLGGFEEYLLGTSDSEQDSDDDDLPDLNEFTAGLDPLGGFIDSDSDGFSDDVEIANDMDPNSPNGKAPSLRFVNAAEFMHFVDGENYDFRVIATDADTGGIDRVEVSLAGKTIEAVSTSRVDEFSASFQGLDASDTLADLEARAYGTDGSRGEAETISIDIAATERWVTLARLHQSFLSFERRMEGEMHEIDSERYYRGGNTLAVSDTDGTILEEVNLENYGNDLIVIYEDQSENSLVIDDSVENFRLNSWLLVNLYGRDVYGTFSYGGDQVSFSIPDGDHQIVDALRPFPSEEENWNEPLEIKADFNNEIVIFSQSEMQMSNGAKNVVYIFPPSREGSTRAVLGSIAIHERPLIIATPFRQGTVDRPGARRHFLENEEDFNLPLLVNDDFDDGAENPDFTDTIIGANDDDLLTINVKIDLRGLTDCERFELKPSSQNIRLYFKNQAGEPELVILNNGTFVSALNDSSWLSDELTSNSGADFFVEGMASSDTENLVFQVKRKDDDDDEEALTSESMKIGPLLKVDLESDKAASGNFFGEEDVRIDPVTLRNPQSFGDIASDDIDPCDRQRSDPALVVFYEDVTDQDYNVEDFDVKLRTGTPSLSGVFQWEKVKGPDSGSLEDANMSEATYANPKTGGLYQFDVDIGEQKVRTSLMLPLAGADITDWFEAEAASIEPWARAHLRATEDENYSSTPFVTRYAVFKTWSLISGAFFDYTLDPVDINELSPCRRYQSTIRRGGEYGYVTVNGIVIHGSKINLTLWSIFGHYWGYSHYHLVAGGHLNSILRGRGLDSESAISAIYLGTQLYRFPEDGVSHPSRIFLLRQMQSAEDLIEEKLWPSPYPMDASKSSMRRPDPDLPTTH